MTPRSRSWRGWSVRLTGAVLIAVVGWVLVRAMDFGPRPLAWFLMVLLGCAGVWLVLDVVDTDAESWGPPRPLGEDRFDETTAHHRVLANHIDATEPGPALRDRLVALARARDPDLSDPELRELALAPPRRLSRSEIDHLLSRIEALRDYS